MGRQIAITVKKGGKTVVEAHGFQGPGCERRVGVYVAKLGGKPGPEQHKPEYYETPTTEQDQSAM